MLNPAKDDEWYDPDKVKIFMGVRPDQVADLLALRGDAVDNIPGRARHRRQGRAGAASNASARWKAAMEHAAEVERKAYRESLQNHAEQIRLSKRLATISTDVPVPFDLDALRTSDPDEALLKTDLQGDGVPFAAEGTRPRAKTPARAIIVPSAARTS